ncbi:MAG: xanthine dehydrogenase family protein molybdopterin-binding subunit [Chloroflexi bacterium]|nr:xanthine dehydrogenase family protein molybdopterin-binding subunit [Chloroflexota bacterium]MBV9897886.1 xanthine dehydrogenase family protein molybdopterin-binding subunit [Chloroflexota bacterium]
MPGYQAVGQPIPRVEGFVKVTGQARYAADFALPGTVWGKCLHAPYSHARIVSIDTSKAERMPGVHAVITGRDTRDGGLWGRAVKDAPPLAFERVRYYGERVAAVAADDEDLAQAALEQIDVEYEELPAVFDPFEAMRDAAPILHPDFNTYVGFKLKHTTPSNIHHHSHLERGDVEQGFADADVIVENTYVTQRQSQGMLEPQSILVSIDPSDDRVHLWHCNKVPYFIRGALAAAAGIPEERIVIHPTYIGGDFGNKGNSRLTPIAYYLAKASGRPVRMISDYTEEFLAGNPRHHVTIQLRTGVKRDGTLTAHTVNHVVNSGAYAAFKSYGTIAGANEAAGPYRVPNSRIDSTFVYTNTVPGGFMRAPGEPEGVFAIESHIDEVARRIGMDPVAFRMKNLIVEGDETAFGHVLHDVRARETLQAAVDASGYNDTKPPHVGRGVAIGERGTGAGEGTVEIRLLPDGRAIIGTPMFDQGTGTYTTIAQVASEELGIPADRFELEVWDTDELESDSGLTGSRGTHVNTLAAFEAAQLARRDLAQTAAEHLGWPEDEVEFSAGQAHRRDSGEVIGWEELLARSGQTIRARAHTVAQRSHRTSFVAQVAEVAVDPETGEIRVLRYTTAHDSGVVLNPLGYQGQVNGGFQHGLGYALMEELVVEDGRVTTLSFGDYKMPTVRDMPPLTTVVLESAQGEGPYNIRGIGEAPCIPVAPAIANAVEDAVGVRIRDLPVTAEKVYQSLRM